MNPLPEPTLRLFGGYDPEELRRPEAQSFVIGRLLEDGDRADLDWLAREVGREALEDWVRERGGRQLSRRSRGFWERVLGVGAKAPSEAASSVWS